MELTPSQKKTVRHQFDSFCRKVLREEARDYERHIAWRSNHEVSLSELSEEQERQMYVLDEYPSEQTHFHVQGYDVAIENEDLANALTVLPDDKRDIVLLAYFLDTGWIYLRGNCGQAGHGTPYRAIQARSVPQGIEKRNGGYGRWRAI